MSIKAILSETFPSPVDAHARWLYRQVEAVRRDIHRLLNDPALGSDPLIATQVQEYQGLARTIVAVEAFSLPVVLRFNKTDAYMTALCARLMHESGVSLPPPLVAAFSTEYYWMQPHFNLICTPALECDSLLGLPDLYHEVAHLLVYKHYRMFVVPTLERLQEYVDQEKRRVQTEQRPINPAHYDLLFVQWEDHWTIEFACDMIATYLVGEAYGWQHLRLCSSTGKIIFHPSLGEASSHPADEARLQSIVMMLEMIGRSSVAQVITEQWHRYANTLGETPTSPGDYSLCYPRGLISALAKDVLSACESLDLRKAAEAPASNVTVSLTLLINEAWNRFISDAVAYSAWEREQIQSLRQKVLESKQQEPTSLP